MGFILLGGASCLSTGMDKQIETPFFRVKGFG